MYPGKRKGADAKCLVLISLGLYIFIFQERPDKGAYNMFKNMHHNFTWIQLVLFQKFLSWYNFFNEYWKHQIVILLQPVDNI